MSFQDDTQGYTYEYTDDGAAGDGLVRIQWRNGDPGQATPGFFFLGKENVPDDFQPEGDLWKPHTEYFKQTKTRAAGWKCEKLPIAIICTRARSFVRDRASGVKTWHTKYQTGTDGAGQHVDVLCVADGLQALGVVVWSTNSTKCAFAIIGRANPKVKAGDGILAILRKQVIDPAQALVKRDPKTNPLPPWCVWVTVECERDTKGEPVYTETIGGSIVTLPTFRAPAKIDMAYLNAVKTGKDMMEYGKAKRAEYDEWKHADFTEAQTAQAASGKNVPRAIEDDDPFPAGDTLL